ncbi:MAG TPA: helix-turn-helix domain-containing protein [bacterium]|nr:helix-turn-helix domain-containing protein [bacterium]
MQTVAPFRRVSCRRTKEGCRLVWGHGYETQFHMLRVSVSNLRHKLEPNPSDSTYILTEAGVGYRLRVDG